MRVSDRESGRLRKYLTQSEIDRLLIAINDNENPTRDRALTLIAFRHGLRVSELIDLRWNVDVDLDAGRLLVRRLKRGRDGVHRLPPDELALLKQLRAQSSSEFVFPGRAGRMSRSNVNRMLKDAGQRAGINVTPHALRHACGYELAMRGLDTRRLQAYLGHRSIMSTVIYTDLAEHATESVWRMPDRITL